MENQMLHTPDGMRDIYNGECQRKLSLQEKLHRVQLSYGYRDIQTPSIEFFNVFGNEVGTTPSKDLYKFFDKEGNTLVLRPDFTPSIARSAAKYYAEEDMPVRLSYMGNTFINSSDYQGRLKETTQCGVELIGDSTVAADAEILAVAVDSMLAAGLLEFQISVGHARFFAGLAAAAGLSDAQQSELRELISNKNFLGAEELIDTLEIDEKLRNLFRLLGSFDAGIDKLKNAIEDSENYPEIRSALTELVSLFELLDSYKITKYISVELGMLGNYHYYTGIIFAGFTFGTGEPVLRGGRYDGLLAYFGKDAPSIGFAIVVDKLMNALLRQGIIPDEEKKNALIVFSEENAKSAIERAAKLREKGICVTMMPHDEKKPQDLYKKYAVDNGFSGLEILI
ncbi:MAG: ATP phosphoribosyltransferase regulatory subunit [Clostridiales bacterium]|nr:ATP phosphoribosyltransferase regulatory subunit [Clostridiales bacterium]